MDVNAKELWLQYKQFSKIQYFLRNVVYFLLILDLYEKKD